MTFSVTIIISRAFPSRSFVKHVCLTFRGVASPPPPSLCVSSITPVSSRCVFFVQRLIIVLIILNTVILAIDHHPLDEEVATYLEAFNFAFTLCFTLEMVIKVSTVAAVQILQSLEGIPFESTKAILSLRSLSLLFASVCLSYPCFCRHLTPVSRCLSCWRSAFGVTL